MRIAVTFEDGNIFGHFGKTKNFKFYDIDNNNVLNSEIVDTNGNGHSALVGFLKEKNVDTIICGGIGEGAKNALFNAGIKVYSGVEGKADESVQMLLNDSLKYNPDVVCSHHKGNCKEHKCN